MLSEHTHVTHLEYYSMYCCI